MLDMGWGSCVGDFKEMSENEYEDNIRDAEEENFMPDDDIVEISNNEDDEGAMVAFDLGQQGVG